MKSRTTSTVNLMLTLGIPPQDFFDKAWASEPLTGVLTETNIPFALPLPDGDISLVATVNNQVVGQCSANRVVKYWNHVNELDTRQQNKSTQTFVSIHKKAVAEEIKHLAQLDHAKHTSFHSAGIAVLPEYRGNQLGLTMRVEQIALCKKYHAMTLFCETTNRYSAATVENQQFYKVASYPYKDLALELNHPELAKLDDSFSVWCRRL